ncbi:MAG: hypothetical protein NTW07_05740 [candidate division Zixibacteria bacterium]|nr:hypothetical protein [candidate division Zixibacteria bacterium]
MGKSIVFVSIFDLTKVQCAIGQGLSERGHSIHWITTNELWTEWLVEQGVDRSVIQQLVYDEKDFVSPDERRQLVAEIVTAEDKADLTVNQSLLMDRFVMYKNKSDINEYMLLYYRDVKRFLRQVHADVVFAEPTHCNELMTYLICHELGIPFIAPGDMRFPRRRVLFYSGYREDVTYPSAPRERIDPEQGRTLIEEFAENRSVPYFFNKRSHEKVVTARKVAISSVNRFKLLLRGGRKGLTHHDFAERLQTLMRRVVNGFYMRHICRYDSLDKIGGKIAFYPLHVQPEASIDVRGSFFSDQLKLIRDIRRALPFDVTLIVKEHTNFLGLRGSSFFRRLRRIPNVKLIPHEVSTFDVYARASLVLTVTGTAAYEAGLLGVPAITFVPMFFGGLSTVRCCSDVTKLKDLAFEMLQGVPRDLDADSRFMDDLVGRSFEAYWTDPLFKAHCA